MKLVRTLIAALQSDRPPLAVRLVVYGAFALVTALSVVRVVRTCHDPQAPPSHAEGLVDFHNAVYYPALAYRQGINPYSVAYAEQFPVNRQYPLYSPATLLLHYPFSLLPLAVGNVVYFAYTFALVFALAASVLAVCRVRLTHVNLLGLATLVLVSRPGHINLMLGQLTLPMALGALWALELARRKPQLAGLALALTTLKPTFGVPIVWLMFCRKDFRAVFAGVVIGGLAALAGAAPFIARDGLAAFVDTLRESQSMHEADPVAATSSSWTRIDALSVVGRFLDANLGGASDAVVAAVCLLLAGAAVYRTAGTPRGEGADSLSSLVVGAATLACIYHSMYDALLLVLPWVGVSVGRLRNQSPAWAAPVFWLLLTIPAANYVSTRTAIERLGLEGTAWTLVTSVNGVAILALVLLSSGIAMFRLGSPRTALSPAPAPGSIAA